MKLIIFVANEQMTYIYKNSVLELVLIFTQIRINELRFEENGRHFEVGISHALR